MRFHVMYKITNYSLKSDLSKIWTRSSYACFISTSHQSTTQSFYFAHLHIFSLCRKINTLYQSSIAHFAFFNFMSEFQHKRDLFDHNQSISETDNNLNMVP